MRTLRRFYTWTWLWSTNPRVMLWLMSMDMADRVEDWT